MVLENFESVNISDVVAFIREETGEHNFIQDDGLRYEYEFCFLTSSNGVQSASLYIDFTQANFNGWRYWLTCPGCKKNYSILYIDKFNLVIKCRNCLGLKYASNNYSPGSLSDKMYSLIKLDNLQAQHKRIQYDGKLTSYGHRLVKLQQKNRRLHTGINN